MTSTLPPHHMYVTREPSHDRAGANWSTYSQRLNFDRALTPPPEMNGASHATKPAYYQQEYKQHYEGHHHQQVYRAPVAPHHAQDGVNGTLGRSGANTQTSSRTMSPVSGPRQPIFDEPLVPSRRGSQANAIAPGFQIPRSVNDSGGSLSELAAQITCLFWFESADILQLVEDSQFAALASRSLVTDAKPTTGFRKWVTTILSTTLVAQNVVLLALLFIYRLKKLNPTVRGKPGSEYRLLTVALMLGNKFLDDNTYTNKTWAEVSGIVVGEVHIMEVEFLSNMKYCLFTSAEDWAKWQSLLGKFAAFVERASKPQPPAPILPPASSLYLPMALPSPPASNQASPPYASDLVHNGFAYATNTQHGPTPVPSPLAVLPLANAGQQNALKRSRDDYSTEPPPKRLASGYQSYNSPSPYAAGATAPSQDQQVSRLTLPSLDIPSNSVPFSHYPQLPSQGQQLPPINVPARAMAMVYPNASTQAPASRLATSSGPCPVPQSQMHSQHQSRQHSPYPGSAVASPTASVPPSATSLHPPVQVSPTYFLQQRSSPYRPVHNVSTLLYPPPSGALLPRSQNVEHSQMHYQPLSKPSQQQQTGRLPYIAQNVWIDGNNHQQPMTPVHQWPGFLTARPQHPLSQQ
ncbi:hypothetical protein LTR36_010893 [Oleoguttula mirabilis]|uniref:Uncharacterized protein n=1 Tax=Oleoguttula mirabilis TaxID=1507867 RepID=A0AAV9J3P5_9PEZI|nr:hypothetical protein LTR36_010893 [Oleoguttula mirabilis]